MDENEFELHEVKYIAVENMRDKQRCRYCAFEDGFQCLDDKEIPECNSEFRVDRNDVIFLEKQQ